MHQKFRDKKVAFIGLSPEDANSLPAMQQFLQRTGITWRNGYGAHETLFRLGAESIPRVWVIGADGKVVWNSSLAGDLEHAIEQALASAN